MNRSKRIYILLGVLAVACVVTFGVMKYEERKEQIKNSDEIILEVPADSVKSLSWQNDTRDMSFHKDEKWLYDDDEAFPTDEEKINELLSVFEEFGVSFIIEEVEDYSQYGLDNPTCTIQIETEDTSYEILLGSYSEMDSERYVSIGDGNVYLVTNDPMDYFDVGLSELIDNDETPSFDSVSGIQFVGTENYSVSYEEDSADTYCADDVYFTHQNGENVPLDTSRVESYLSNISGLSLDEYVTYNAADDELESYGLNDPELTVSVDYTYENEDGEEVSDTFVLNISRSLEERKAAEEAADEDSEASEKTSADDEEEITAYARVGDSQIGYQILAGDSKSLMEASYNDLRHQEVFTAGFDDVYQIDISLEDKVYTLSSEEKDDERTWYYQEEEIELASFKSALNALEADSFTGEEPTGKEEISVTVYLDNENYPKIQIRLYRYDGNYCLAVVDGETISQVERSSVVDLIEAVQTIVLN